MWWRSDGGRARRHTIAPGPWPRLTIADTRAMLRADETYHENLDVEQAKRLVDALE